MSVISGRLAYVLGLEGPALAVDTACSSSLVALHLACQALREGECSLALGGGVSVMTAPGLFVEFARARGLSPDGRCKSFAAAADGVGFGDGAGMLVLERLSDARRNGHPVQALVRGSAVNQDGASNGLTAPNGPSQERVIRQALASAGLDPADVDAVEAHGTGTTLGDPIEAGALIATYGQERADGPLRLGSIKSNVGHAVAAAGVAGVMKMVMALREEELPATLHVDQPSPEIDWSAGAVELLREPAPWPRGARVRRAGISSFGVSGTNAHLIVEEPPALEGAPAGSGAEHHAPALALPLSARSEAALRGGAKRLAAHLRERPDLDLADVSFSLASTRARFERRGVVTGTDRDGLLSGLDALAVGQPAPGVHAGQARATGTAFLFSGQGAQRPGMGIGLAAAFPVFAAAFDLTTAALEEQLRIPLRDAMSAPEDSEEAALLDHTETTQAALFAHEVSLFRLLESLGLRPDLLIGHSIGELVAAHVAGVMSLEDAATLVAARGRLMGALPAGGAMLAVEAAEGEIEDLPEGVSLAAVNSPSSLVLSGGEPEIEDLGEEWRAGGRRVSRLRVSHAFHSPLMEPMLAEFAAVAASLDFQAPRIPIVSNLTGGLVGEEIADPGYWVRHVREPVRFAAGVAALAEAGAGRFLELGPDPVLGAPVAQCLEDRDGEQPLIACAQRSGQGQAEALLAFLAGADADGAEVDWAALHEGRGARTVELPTYAFQRQRYWLNPKGEGAAAGLGPRGAEHPLLDTATHIANENSWLFSGRISLATHPWIGDHVLLDTVVVPGTAFVELVLAAGATIGCETLEELTLLAPLVLEEGETVELQLSVADAEAGRREFAVSSRAAGASSEAGAEPAWTRHAAGALETSAEAPVVAGTDDGGGDWPPPGAEPLDIDGVYADLARVGYAYGPSFAVIRAAWRRGEELFTEVALDDGDAAEARRFGLHPGLFDAVVHAGAVLEPSDTEGAEPGKGRMLFSWGGVRCLVPGSTSLRVRIAPAGPAAWNVSAFDERGAAVLAIDSLAHRPIEQTQLTAKRRAGGALARVEWRELPSAGAAGVPVVPTVLGELDAGGIAVDRYADVAALGRALDDGASPPPLVLAALPRNDGAPGSAASAEAATLAAIELLREWLADERLASAQLALLSEGAVAAAGGDSPDAVAATVLGALRSAQAEQPGRIAIVDLDRSPASWQALAGSLAGEERQLALRDGVAYVPRLVAAAAPAAERLPLDPEGTVLITGGTGGLGAALARHLAATHGVRRLLLAGRAGPEAAGAAELRAELAELGCQAELRSCDVADREALAALLDSVPTEHPLTGVVHAAGVLDDALLADVGAAQLERVMRAKARGAEHLHELTRDRDLAALVFCSSITASTGSPGQASYAAANAYLDALAQRRRGEGLPAVSIAWGPWSEVGMTRGRDEADLARLLRSGVAPLPVERALELFDQALASAEPVLVAAQLETGVLRARAAEGTLAPLLSGMVPTQARRAQEHDALARRLAATPAEQWSEVVTDLIRAEVAAVLGSQSAAAVDASRPFVELGFDSLDGVELRNRVIAATGIKLPATAMFDHPTAAALAEHLCSRVAEDARSHSQTRVDEALGAVEALLGQLAEDDEARVQVQEPLSRFSDRLQTFLADPHEGAADLAAASDSEMFDVIDAEGAR